MPVHDMTRAASSIVGLPATGARERCLECGYGPVQQGTDSMNAAVIHSARCPLVVARQSEGLPLPPFLACRWTECRKVLDPVRVAHGATACNERHKTAAWKSERLYGQAPVALIPIYGREGVIAHALVDPEDYARLSQYRWHRNSYGYLFRNLKRVDRKRPSPRFMHREVMGIEPGDSRQIDHRHHDLLDNRKASLRVVNQVENQANRRGSPKNSRHGLRGVHLHRPSGLWHASVRVDGQSHSIGYHETPEQAAEIASLFRQMMTPTSEMDRPEARANGRTSTSGLTASVPKLLRVLVRDFDMSEADARAAVKRALSDRQRAQLDARERSSE